MDIKTKRLMVRPVSMDDKESLYTYRSDAETNQYLSMVPSSIDDIENFINKTSKIMNVPDTWYQLVLLEQASNQVIGDVGIHFLGPENNQVEIGYTLDKRYRGHGYMTEALSEIIDYLVHSLNKHRIIASIDPINLDSMRLVERLGFRKEAHFKESLFFHGKWVDDVIYAILAKEWKEEIIIHKPK